MQKRHFFISHLTYSFLNSEKKILIFSYFCNMRSLNGSSPVPGVGVAPTRSQLSELSSENGSTSCAEHAEESQETESKATKWTDEKHSLYLNSMEASFVNQLYNSLDMLDWRPIEEGSPDPKVSGQKHSGKGRPTPSGQFKVFRDGSWARINFGRETTPVKKVEGPGTLSANPWIKHYKSSCRHGTRISPAFQERVPLATDSHLQLERQASVGSNTEVTDQNFVDEDFEGENSSRIRSKKCRRITKAASSGNDQVVPFENIPFVKDVAAEEESSKG